MIVVAFSRPFALKLVAGLPFPDAQLWFVVPIALGVFYLGCWLIEWLGSHREGFLLNGTLYCCKGCADGSGCICRTANQGLSGTKIEDAEADRLIARDGGWINPEAPDPSEPPRTLRRGADLVKAS